jgi:hypothetical protein
VFIQHAECSIDNCLSDIISKTCRSSSSRRLPTTNANRINNFQTQFVSIDPQTITDPSVGHQYICCYDQTNSIVLAQALTALARKKNKFISTENKTSIFLGTRSLFTVYKPEFSLVTGDVLTYRCEGHELIYDDLRMIYNDDLFTYERNRADAEWRLMGTNQPKQIDIDWLLPTRFLYLFELHRNIFFVFISENIRDTVIEVKTPPLRKIGKNGFLQCTALSKRVDVIPNMNDTYMINVDGKGSIKYLYD